MNLYFEHLKFSQQLNKLKKFLIYILGFYLSGCIPGTICAQWSKTFINNTHVFGLGGVDAPVEGILGMGGNPAAITSSQNPQLAFSTTNLYGIPGLFYHHIAATTQFAQHHIGLMAGRFGDQDQTDSFLSFLYSRPLGENIALGAGLNLLQFRIKEYGHQLTTALDAGILWSISKQVKTGYSVFIHHTGNLDLANSLTMVQKLGVAYSPTDFLSFYSQVNWIEPAGWQLHGGLEYKIHPSISLTFGVRNNPFIGGFGTSIRIVDKLSIQVAAQFHQALGLSPSAGVTIDLK